jgi:hypothetical protein
MAVKPFAEMTLEALAEAGDAIGNMSLHPGWPVLMGLLERLEQQSLERMGECKAEELARLQGERDALHTLRRLIIALPQIAEDTIATRAEDGEVDEAELMLAVRTGGGGGVTL